MRGSVDVRRARLALLWVAALGTACASGPEPQPAHLPGVVRVGQGPAVALAGTTPTGARRPPQLAMFIDAGSRDGAAPYVAAIAAQLLAEQVGRDAQARAFPDGLEVLTVCDDGLRSCVARLARGLALRMPNDAAIARALNQLANAERGARAGDPQRGADELAVRALWPSDGGALVPLDLHAAPSTKATYESVRAFIADAFGPSRTLIAASGLSEVHELSPTVNAAFEHAPEARAARQRRELPQREHAAVEVAVDETSAISLALRAGDVALATRAAGVLRDELLRSKLARSVTGQATSLRGGALALLRVKSASSDMAPLVSRASYVIARMRLEGAGSAPLPLPRDEPIAALRRIGVRFATGAAAPTEGTAVDLGIGVLVAGARGDRLNERDPDAAQRASERSRLTTALEAGAQLAEPELDGDLGEDVAIGVLANHSRVAAQALAAEQVAIAVKLNAGAASDPPAQHGRAALLASVMTVACAGRSPAALRAELDALSATLEPIVSARTLGIVLRAPAEHARAAIALAVDCALRPSLARGDVTRARLLLLDRLRFASRDLRLPRGGADLRAQVARALSAERTPGALAPWGGSSTLPSVDERALNELLGRSLRGSSVSVAIAGALDGLDARSAARLAARRLSILPSEPASAPQAPSTSTAPARTARAKASGKAAPSSKGATPSPLPPQAVEALLVWSTPACASDVPEAGDAARAFAAAVSSVLSSSELHVPWLDGDCAAGLAWAALLVRGPATRIAALSGEAARATTLLEPRALLQAALAAGRKRAGTADGLAEHAQALAEAAWPSTPVATNPEDEPLVVIGRLRAAPVQALAIE